MPVADTARSTPARPIAPAAIASATSALTAQAAARVASGTPTMSILALLEYVTKARSTTSDEPAIAVSAAATRPPVQLSAVAIRQPLARHADNIAVARSTVSRSNTEHSFADRDDGNSVERSRNIVEHDAQSAF